MRVSAVAASCRSRPWPTRRCSSAPRSTTCRRRLARPDARGHGAGPRRLVPRGGPRRRHLAALRHRVDGCRGPALHPLHVRFDRQAQGHPAHDRGLPALHDAHVQVHVRLPRRGRLLVHRRHRLDHRSQLHRVRAARARRDVAHVRGRAHLSGCRPLLAGRREARRQPVLHRADGDPRADEGSATSGRPSTTCRVCASWARSASRSTPRRGCGTTRSSATRTCRSSTPTGRPRPVVT